jgi:hypothetical protein
MALEWLTPERVAKLGRETTVEDDLVIPLFDELGYGPDDRQRGVPVDFMRGSTRGRKPEADIVYYDGPERSKDTSLVTVEAKGLGESLQDASGQADY